MQTMKRWLALLMALALLISYVPMPVRAAEVVDSGSCGDTATWSLDSDGVLTISGTGEMGDYWDEEKGNSNAPWAESAENVTRIIVEEGITRIGNGAFALLMSADEVTLPESLTAIGEYAFGACMGLKSITIPENVVSIGTGAFSACMGLESVTIPKNVTTIGAGPFVQCEVLEEILVDENNQNYVSDEYGVLYNKDKTHVINAPARLEDGYEIPEGVTHIDEAAFAHCQGLKSVTIPGSVDSIGASAFTSGRMTELTISEGVTEIGEMAFYDCWYLPSVTIPSSVVKLGAEAFAECEYLETIRFMGDAPTIEGDLFTERVSATVYYPADNATWTEDVMQQYGGTVTWEVYTEGEETEPTEPEETEPTEPEETEPTEPEETEPTVPEETEPTEPEETEPVQPEIPDVPSGAGTVVAEGVYDKDDTEEVEDLEYITWQLYSNGLLVIFGTGEMTQNPWNAYNSSITEVIIGNGVTSIGDYAFYDCNGLTSVTIPESVTSIGPGAFNGCSSLTSVMIPESVTSIGDSAFYECSSLTSVTIPEGITSIGDYVFYKCSSLSSVTIPEGVTSIGNRAFDGCTGLPSVTIPESVTSIGNWAFTNCTSLTNVAIPEGVTSIGHSVFSECSSLTSVTIPKGVTSINDMTFHSCSSLTSVTIPENVTSIGYGAFFYCTNLTSVTLPVGLIGSFTDAYRDTGISSITLSGSGSIVDRAFINYSNLTSVTILEGVTSIGDYAFNGCSSLTSVTIPESVTSIGDYAFNGCSGLTSVTIPESVTSIGDYAFYGCSGLTSVMIPESVTSIGNWAFTNCTSLTNVAIPEGVTSIGDYAFYDCSGLKTITFEGDAPELGSNALYYWWSPALKAYYPAGNETWTEEKLQEYTANACYGSYYVEWIEIGEFEGIEAVEIPGLVVGEELNPANIKVVAKYDNGLEVELDDVEIGECDTSETGRKVVVITYRDQKIEVEVPVHAGRKTVTLDKEIYPESTHNSSTSLNETKTLVYPGAESITLTFSEESSLSASGWGSNYLYVYDANDNQIAYYSPWGSSPSGATVTVPGDTVKIQLQTYSSCYGYSFSSITAETLDHTGEAVADVEATCTEDGSNGGIICDICGEHVFHTVVPALGHDWVDGVCSRCKIDFSASGTTSNNQTWEINKQGVLTISGEGSLYVMPWQEYVDMVTAVVIEEGISEIGGNVFQNHVNLKSVSIANTVTSIGYRAFAGCTSLESIVIPESVTYMNSYVFDGCTSLKTVEIKGSINSISYGVFQNCSALAEITLPESLIYINDGAFLNCSSLETLKIPSTVTSLGDETFRGCTSLTSIVIPEGVTTIGERLFYECSALKSVTIPESVSEIDNYAFYRCENLESVIIPGTLDYMGYSVFLNCFNLKSATIENGGEYFTSLPKYTFHNCKKMETVVLPDTIKSIGYRAFHNCIALKNLDLPNTVTGIAYAAFHNCESLTELALPTTLTSIGGDAFGCSGLNEITFQGNAPANMGANMFWEVEADAYYPANDATWTADKMQNYGGNITWVTSGCAHKEETVAGKAATCTATGLTEGKKCSVCGEVLVAQTPIAALGHKEETVAGKAATCTATGLTEGKKCSVCGEVRVAQTPIDALGHNYEGKVTKEATCNEKGIKTFTCKNNADHTYTEEIAAKGHTEVTVAGKAATCTATGLTEGKKCSSCGAETVAQKEIAKLAHTEVTLPGKAATCAEAGLTEGAKCSVCDTVTKAQNEIAKLPHSVVKDAAVEADCTTSGLTAGEHCATCGTILVAQEFIPAGHKIETVAGKAATCTEAGLSDGTYCSVCEEVLTEQKEIPATGHLYATEDDVTYTCVNCDDSFTVEVKKIVEEVLNEVSSGTITEEKVAEAVEKVQEIETEHLEIAMKNDAENTGIVEQITQLEELVDTNVNVQVKDEAETVFDQEKVSIVGAKLNDVETEGEDISLNIGEPEGEAAPEIPAEYNAATAVPFSMKLENVQNVKDLKVPVKITLPVPAGMDINSLVIIHYNDNGSIKELIVPTVIEVSGEHYACFVVTGFSNFAITEKHSHSFGDWTVTKAADCENNGIKVRECDCGETETETILATGHTIVIDKAVAATCTEKGKTSGKHCSVCEKVIQAQSATKALGHSYENGKCVRCGNPQPTEPEKPVIDSVSRLAGASKYETSFTIANELKDVLGVDKFDTVVLANSDNFADALAGSYLAAEMEAPIIIGKEKYASLVCEYLNENLAEGGTVYILGGTVAMPDSILGEMTVKYNPVRLAGDNRYDTNLAILEEAGVSGKDILVATGQDFADSLSASATGLPILLVNGKPDKTLSDAQKEFLAGVTGKIYIIGGESAVPDSMVQQIEAASGKETTRIAGGSRYETSVKIAEQFLADADSAVVAYASTFPDGLCGGPLAYAVGAPLILTKDNKSEAPDYTIGNGITSGYVLGGEGLISDDFAKNIFNAAEIVK